MKIVLLVLLSFKTIKTIKTINALLLKLLHPVSITRFPLTRFSPGAGLLRNPFVHW